MTNDIARSTNTNIDELLKIDDDKGSSPTTPQQSNSDIELPPLRATKHTVATSPWSRMLIIAVPFGMTFLVIFLFLNGIFNSPTKMAVKIPTSQNPSTASEKVDLKDGKIYAELALSKQQDELNKINNRTQQPKSMPEVKTSQTPKVVAASPPPPTTRSVRSVQQTPRTTSTSSSVRPMRSLPTLTSASPPRSVQQTTATAKPLDPTTEFTRLRSYGSFGDIAYTDSTIEVSSPDEQSQPVQLDPTQPISTPNNVIENQPTQQLQQTPPDIEKIRPRFVTSKVDKPMLVANSYLPQEAQILQQSQTHYLMVGQFASGVLVTPVIKQESNTRNPQLQAEDNSDNKRFVAKLTEDLPDNYGNIAIPSGTLLAIEMVKVDGGSYATVEVTSIIKDNTEYPISRGAISVLAAGGKPLIAKKFQDKGGEIAQYDITLGLVSGLGKVGQVLNQSDTTTIINSSSNSYSSSSSSSSRRDIGGAFLEGAFGTLSSVIGKRTEAANNEIAARPNVWYIAKDTPITFMVNRTLELP